MRDVRFLLISFLVLLFIVAGGYFLWLSRVGTTFPVESTFVPALLPPQESTVAPTMIRLTFAGDVMLDRNIRLKAQQNGYNTLIGPELRKLLLQSDEVIVNLEGPITSNQSVSVGSAVGSSQNFLFTFDPESATFLRDNNISLVNLGNNHILNFGQDGLAETYQLLEEAGILYFGYTGVEKSPTKFTAITTIGEYKIGFVNYNQFIWEGENQVFVDIKKLRPEVDFLIVYTHWGNEYVPENAVLKDLAHRMVDAGADLIIGSHPHVITGNEIYKEKPIYYSLGNFIFDQYFEPAVQKGLVLETTIDPKTGQISIQEHTVKINPSGQTELLNTIK